MSTRRRDWTRTETKSGPVNTYRGRYHVTRGASRAAWHVVDLARPDGPAAILATTPTAHEARAWIVANAERLP